MLYPKDVKNGEVYPVKFTTVITRKLLQKILVLKAIMYESSARIYIQVTPPSNVQPARTNYFCTV